MTRLLCGFHFVPAARGTVSLCERYRERIYFSSERTWEGGLKLSFFPAETNFQIAFRRFIQARRFIQELAYLCYNFYIVFC